VGMQLIAEGLAIAAFRFMQHESKDALLKEMLEYVIKDESRHVGFGVLALRDGIKKLSPKERTELEDFCFTACDMMVTKVEDGVARDGFLSGMSVFEEVGISSSDLDEEMKHNPAWAEAEADMDKKFNSFLFVDTIVPNLKNLGLMNERTEPRYRDLGVLEMYAG
jgi:hypothetical protein